MGWLGLGREEFYTITPAELRDMLEGWRELREGDSIERWRQVRTIISFNLQTVSWKNGQAPDMLKIMPLPGDASRTDEIDINEDTPENARRWWKMSKNLGVTWSKWKQDIIDKHYKSEWDVENGAVPTD